ncbi:MAG: GtrA family protein, partial [Candidatus Peribacteraceae bacterium]|nr:GtrA family protein [Candidatus Peribacteraceae bacterium]
IEGFLAAKGDVLAVMDADGQHDSELLKRLYEAVRGGSSIAVGSRYAKGGSVGQWDERRHFLSRVATRLGQAVCSVKVSDPMSGFFAIDARLFERVRPSLNPKGFKILLDLLVHIPKDTRVVEHAFMFGGRLHGESKMSRRVQVEFLEYLYDVTIGRFIPLTFLKYCVVGFLGVFVNVGAYWVYAELLRVDGIISFAGFSVAVIVSIETAIIFNFLLNNVWTFAHKQLRGASALVGFAKYNIACALGALVNYAVSALLVWRAWPELLAVTIGSFTAVLWNYVMSRMVTWKD